MVDPEVVRRRLREIDRRVAALRAVAAGDREALLDDLVTFAGEVGAYLTRDDRGEA